MPRVAARGTWNLQFLLLLHLLQLPPRAKLTASDPESNGENLRNPRLSKQLRQSQNLKLTAKQPVPKKAPPPLPRLHLSPGYTGGAIPLPNAPAEARPLTYAEVRADRRLPQSTMDGSNSADRLYFSRGTTHEIPTFRILQEAEMEREAGNVGQ